MRHFTTKDIDKNAIPKDLGFTLIELLIVLTIIGVIAAIAIPVYNGYVKSAKIKSATAVLEQFPVLLEQYRAENGKFPPNTAGNSYDYNETAAGVITDEITKTPVAAGTAAGLTDFSPRSSTFSATKGISFDYSLNITNSGNANEKATYSAKGVRDGAGINLGPFTYK